MIHPLRYHCQSALFLDKTAITPRFDRVLIGLELFNPLTDWNNLDLSGQLLHTFVSIQSGDLYFGNQLQFLRVTGNNDGGIGGHACQF